MSKITHPNFVGFEGERSPICYESQEHLSQLKIGLHINKKVSNSLRAEGTTATLETIDHSIPKPRVRKTLLLDKRLMLETFS